MFSNIICKLLGWWIAFWSLFYRTYNYQKKQYVKYLQNRCKPNILKYSLAILQTAK